MKVLINADDFGWSKSCTDAILQSFEKGYITSTTMCANGDAFDYAVQEVKKTEYKDRVGIHFVLTEGQPLTEAIRRNPLFCDEQGQFHGQFPRYQPLNRASRQQVREELTAQAKRFADSGLAFHHADSHHHSHTAPFITPIVRSVMKEFGITGLRLHRNIGVISGVKRLWKRFWNSWIQKLAYTDYFGSFEDLEENRLLLEQEGVLELMCHPDLDGNSVVVDRAGDAPYDAPFGVPMEQYVKLVKKEDVK